MVRRRRRLSVQVAVVDESQPLNGWRRVVVHAERSCRGHQDGESSASVRYEMTAQRGQRTEGRQDAGEEGKMLAAWWFLPWVWQRAEPSRGAGLDRLTQGCDGGV